MNSPAPPLQASQWFNTPQPLSLEQLRGRVVAIHAFQMLCPGCVMHGIPQAVRLQQTFDSSQVVVMGLHTVFEHHAVMGPAALEVFVHENRLRFPIAVDAPAPQGDIPLTMAALGLQGTPSWVLIDRTGQVALTHFGQMEDLALGAVVGQLIAQPPSFLANTPIWHKQP